MRVSLLAAAPLALVALTAASHPTPGVRTVAVASADTALARFAGTWTLTAHRTPVGTFSGTLVVAPGTGSTLAIPALGVARVDLSGLVARGDTLDVPAAFFASPPGDHLSTSMRLVRQDDGTLGGAWAVTGSDGSEVGTFRVTAVRGD